MKASIVTFGLLVLAAALAACGPTTGLPGGGPGGTLPDGEGPRRLVLLGEPFQTVSEGESLTLEVRYLRENGAVIPQGLVELEVSGELAGASLSARAAETDADGLASFELRAGGPTRLTVTASALGVAEPATVTVDVLTPAFGQLEVTLSYRGGRTLRGVELGLFANATCTDVVRRSIAASVATEARAGGIVTFERVEIGAPVAVFAVAMDRSGFVAADGCLDATLAGPRQVGELLLGDLPETFGGTYDVTETFDVTAGMGRGLDSLLGAMSGLSGDPAQFLVSLVAGSDSTPSWLRSALENPIMAGLVVSTLREAIEGVELPGLLDSTLDLGADLDRALSGMVLTGELVLGEPDEMGSAAATHRLTGMGVPVDGALQSRPIRAEAELVASLGAELALPEHSLPVSFGALIETILAEILLPRLPGSPRTIRALTGSLFDCAAIARHLAGDSSLAASLANAACEVGVGMVADRLQGMLTDLAEYDDLALSGRARLADSDGDYDRDTILPGALDALWTGADGRLELTGSIAGSLRDDTSGRTHPIRDRLRTLL